VKKTRELLLLLVIGMLLIPAAFAHAATVRVSWNSNSETDLGGYRVYYGTQSRIYPQVVDVGITTNTNISGLSTGVRYYFAVTAYDTAGNESDFSAEASTEIPEEPPIPGDPDDPEQTDPVDPLPDTPSETDDPEQMNPDDPDQDRETDSDFDGIPDNIEILWGLDPLNPLDSMMDCDGDGVINLVEYLAGTDPFDATQAPEHDQVLVDVIGEVGEIIDLSSINPGEHYLVIPLDDSSPEPVDNGIVATSPGVYLYNVLKHDFELVYRLRISITSRIFLVSSFEPGYTMSMEDVSSGVGIELSSDSLSREVLLGLGNTDLGAVSAIVFVGENSIEFDILPYGLSLAKPASIAVFFEGENPAIERYDSWNKTWMDVSPVDVTDGLVKFSTQELGKFRISSEETEAVEVSESDASGGGCFITSARF